MLIRSGIVVPQASSSLSWDSCLLSRGHRRLLLLDVHQNEITKQEVAVPVVDPICELCAILLANRFNRQLYGLFI